MEANLLPEEAFRARVKANSFLTSLFVSEDGRATSVLVDFDDKAINGMLVDNPRRVFSAAYRDAA